MKTFFLVISSIYSLNSSFPEIDHRRYDATLTMAYSQITTSLSLKEFKHKIQNYGCHCFPNYSRLPGGKGKALNEVDSICKSLADCHFCLAKDYDRKFADRYRYELDSNN